MQLAGQRKIGALAQLCTVLADGGQGRRREPAQRQVVEAQDAQVFRDGRFTLLCPEDEQLFAYTRDTETEHLLVVCNFSGREASFDFPAEYRGAECLVSNYKEPSVQTIRPYEAWMLIKKEC